MDLSALMNSGIDLSQLPEMLKGLNGFIDKAKDFIPMVVQYAEATYQPKKGNLLSVNLIPKGNKIFIFINEFANENGKDYIYKTHWKGEAFELFEDMKNKIPFNIG